LVLQFHGGSQTIDTSHDAGNKVTHPKMPQENHDPIAEYHLRPIKVLMISNAREPLPSGKKFSNRCKWRSTDLGCRDQRQDNKINRRCDAIETRPTLMFEASKML
jgi:hypothetical protein